MPGLDEIVRSLYGAWRLARFQADGLRYFDATLGGFWRSFFAAVIVAPIYAWLLASRTVPVETAAGSLRLSLVEGIAYVVSWVAYPLLMVSITRLLDRESRFLGYIVAYNWSLVIQHALFLPVAVVAGFGLLPEDAAQLVSLVVFGYILAYVWFIAASGLALPALGAVGVVVCDVLLSLGIGEVARALY